MELRPAFDDTGLRRYILFSKDREWIVFRMTVFHARYDAGLSLHDIRAKWNGADISFRFRKSAVRVVSNRARMPQNAKAKYKYPNLQAPKKIQPESTHTKRRHAF
jgi:hypothetical protein